MQLNENQLKELDTRCDLTLRQPTFKRQIEMMGDWLNVDIERLPAQTKAKFRRVLQVMALSTFTG